MPRGRAFWIVAGLTLGAACLRFATLGDQAYHHDEIVTASRVLRADFAHAMEAVGFSESAPPLYYVLAWPWTQVTGTGEFGLRSLSALAGVATVPVAYLLTAELTKTTRSAVPYPDITRIRNSGTNWGGVVAAALVAVNPMLVWYSQEARAYALLVLFTAAAALYFVRALGESSGRRNLTLWGVFAALALATHYFAIFPLALEAVWLLRRRGRDALAGLWIPVVAGLALTPLLLHQMSYGHAEWIGGRSLGHRLWEVGVSFVVGETGDIVARPETSPLAAALPLLLVLAALALLFVRGGRRERWAGGTMLALAAVTVAAPLLLAVLSPGKDYVLSRNLLPALVPLLVAMAIGTTVRGSGSGAPFIPHKYERRTGSAGAVVAALLVAYSLGFCVFVAASPGWQRPDWRAAAQRIGEPRAPRAIVLWTIGAAPLRWYLSTGAIQARPTEGFAWSIHEADFVSDGPAPPVPPRLLGPGFRQVAYERVGRLYVRRYVLPGPDLAPLRLNRIRNADLNFRSNGVLLDGIGPP